jgi:prepilin-type N-terminal cleavage/methylation domain-containing protein
MQSSCSQPSGRTVRPLRDAFSMIELVVVLMILGILAATAMPTFYRTLEQQRLESAARRVRQDLEQLRQTARTLSKTETLTATSATAYTLSSDVQGLDHKNLSYAIDLALAPYYVSNITTSTGFPAQVSFDGFGTTTTSGNIIMRLGAFQRTLTLDSSTGQVSITNP